MPLKSFSLDSYFVKDPSKDFFQRYYINLYEWSKEVVLDKKSIKSSSLEKCFLEWKESDYSRKRFLTDKRILRPMMFEFTNTNSTSSWNIILVGDKKMDCLSDAHGGRWNNKGELISTFKWDEGKNICLSKKLVGALFETSADSCRTWRFDQLEVVETLIQGFRSYSKLRIESESKIQDYYFFKAFDILSLSNVDRAAMKKFKYDWKVLVHGIYFDADKNYKLLLP